MIFEYVEADSNVRQEVYAECSSGAESPLRWIPVTRDLSFEAKKEWTSPAKEMRNTRA